jgi:hypothetical protein
MPEGISPEPEFVTSPTEREARVTEANIVLKEARQAQERDRSNVVTQALHIINSVFAQPSSNAHRTFT